MKDNFLKKYYIAVAGFILMFIGSGLAALCVGDIKKLIGVGLIVIGVVFLMVGSSRIVDEEMRGRKK